MTSPIARIGEVMQLAFVPADFDAALAHWLKVGAGPFFALDHVKLDEVRYRGQPAEIDFSMVLGYWGDLQIELIRQHNAAPSIYKTWRPTAAPVLARPTHPRPHQERHIGPRARGHAQ